MLVLTGKDQERVDDRFHVAAGMLHPHQGAVRPLRDLRIAQHHVGRHPDHRQRRAQLMRSEEHTSELQSLMRISYAVFCLKKKKKKENKITKTTKEEHNTHK